MKVELHHHPLWRQAVEVSTATHPPQEQHWVQISRVRVTKGPLRTPSKQGFDNLLKFLARRRQMVLGGSAFTASTPLNDARPLQLTESLG
jgi:hypothetical protein